MQALCFADNPTIKQSLSKIKQSRSLLKISKAQEWPTFNLQAGYEYAKAHEKTAYLLDEDVYKLGLDASWEIDIFGSNRKKTEVKEASFMQTIQNLNNVYVSLSSEIALVYIDYRLAQEQKNILEEE